MMRSILSNFIKELRNTKIFKNPLIILTSIVLISHVLIPVIAETFRTPHTRINDDRSDTSWETNCDIAWNATTGEIYVVWLDGRNGGNDVYFSKSLNGGKTFTGQIRINQDAFGKWQGDPSICWNPSNGFIYVVWSDPRFGSDIYFARSEDGGDSWIEPINNPINDEFAEFRFGPDVATDGTNVYVAWIDYRRNPNADIFFSKSIDDGDNWLPNIRLTDVDLPGNITAPSITSAQGNVYVSWADGRREGGPYDIHLNRSLDGGSSWPWSNQMINSDPLGAHNTETCIVTNSTGQNVYIVWQDDRWSPGSWEMDVYLDRSSDYGATWLPNEIQVDDTPNGGNSFNPHIAVQDGLTDDSLYVVWADYRNNNDNDIYYSNSTDSGDTWSSPNERVDDTDINYNQNDDSSAQRYPVIAVNTTGNIAYVAWYDDRDGTNDIWFSKSNIGSGVWYTPNVNVDNRGYDDNYQMIPSIATDNTGKIHAVWADDREGDWDIFHSNSADNGVTWSPDAKVNKGDVEAYRGNATIAIDKSNNNIYVVWESDISGNLDVYLANSTDGGMTFSDAVRVNDQTSGRQFNPDIAVDHSNHNVYVVWKEDPWLSFSRSTNFGQSFNASVEVYDGFLGPGNSYTPAVAVDSNNGNIYVTWSYHHLSPPPGGRRILFANSTDFGESFGSNKIVSDNTSDVSEYNPDIAVNGSGDIVIVWEGEDADGQGILSTYSHDFGDTFGDGVPDSDVIVNDNTLGDQKTPALTADGTYFYSVWRDERNTPSLPDIFFSKSGDGGLNWGLNHEIGSVIMNKSREYPCITTFADQVYVAWLDNRSDPKYDVYFSNGTILDSAPWVIDLNEVPDSIPAGIGKVNITANGSDDEDLENVLTVVFEYRDQNWLNWNTTYLETATYVGIPQLGYWHINFTPPPEAPLGYYDFRIRFQDQTGRWSDWFYVLDAVFVSFPPDITPPIITSGPVVTVRTDITATIEWTTDEPAIGLVWYGLGALDTESSPSLLSTFHSITLTNLAPGRLYHFRVNSTDQEGNNMTSPEFTFSTKFPIFLEPGWNMISVPLNQTETDLGRVLESIDGDYDAVQCYDATDSTDPWEHNHIAKPHALNDLDEINRYKGIWLHITNPLGTTLYVNGTAPDVGYINQITLYKGWNFVGYPSLIERDPVSAGLPVDVNGVFWYNATSAQWEIWDPGTYYDPDTLHLLKPGQGLWIHYTGTTDVWSLEYVS